MNIILHYPDDQQLNEQIRKRTAEIHADAITEYLKALDCSDDQKLELLDLLRSAPPLQKPPKEDKTEK